MTRKLYIFLTALLVATHAFAVPWHVVTAHGLGHVHIDDEGGLLHAIGAEDTASQHHHEAASTACPPEVFDASSFGPAHHHPGHAHSITDHGFARKRIGAVSLAPVAIVPTPERVVQPSVLIEAQTAIVLPAPSPRLNTATLRGPPVC